MNFDNTKYQWNVVGNKDFAIQVCCWRYSEKSDEWIWNVYAYIFDTHPLFKEENRGRAEGLPFHGGCTFSQLETKGPMLGVQYDWEKVNSYLKVGCDYNHYGDDRFQMTSPEYGVPYSIRKDVEELKEALAGWSDGQVQEPT